MLRYFIPVLLLLLSLNSIAQPRRTRPGEQSQNTPTECSHILSSVCVFQPNSSKLTKEMQKSFAVLSDQMRANPGCKIVLIGAGNNSKLGLQRSWDRVNTVIVYMSEKHNIDRNRFIFQSGQPGDPATLLYRVAFVGEDGPSAVAPPFPNLRRD